MEPTYDDLKRGFEAARRWLITEVRCDVNAPLFDPNDDWAKANPYTPEYLADLAAMRRAAGKE